MQVHKPHYNATKKSFVPVHFASQHPRSSKMIRIIMLLEKHLSAIFQHTGDIENKLKHYKKHS